MIKLSKSYTLNSSVCVSRVYVSGEGLVSVWMWMCVYESVKQELDKTHRKRKVKLHTPRTHSFPRFACEFALIEDKKNSVNKCRKNEF